MQTKNSHVIKLASIENLPNFASHRGAKGPLGLLKKSLRSGPKGPKEPLGPLKSRFAPGSMPGVTQNGRLHLLFHAQNLAKWAASPPILGFSGHAIQGVANHLGGLRAWIPERSDFFQGPKGPLSPLGPERSGFFRGPKAPWAPWARSEATFLRGPKAPWAPWALSLIHIWTLPTIYSV